MKRELKIGALLYLLGVSPAFAQCENLPTDVQSYLKAHPGWRVLEVKDIDDPDDQKLWLKNRPGLCPGLATVDVDGNHRMSHVLALLGNQSGKDVEKVVLLWHDGKPQTEQTLVEPFPWGYHIGPHMVIWRAAPGVCEEWDDAHAKTKITHDSIAFESIGANVTPFYLSKGKFRTLTISN